MANAKRAFPALNDALTRRIVEKTAEVVKGKYIFEEDAAAMADLLLTRLREGAFNEHTDLQRLTGAITEMLHSVREDLHLAALSWMPPVEDVPHTGDLMESLRSRWRRNNHEFRKIEILLGNVGYVDLRGFTTAASGGPTAAAAMQFLADTDALIFDLRDNGGGRDLVYFLMSYLFDEPTHVHTARHRDHDEQAWTYGYVPGPRFPKHPVYVLISRATFSAAEDFSYNLQQQGRVTVIGEQTKGGAHPVEFHRFPDLFLELAIPNAYSENPVSGGNWEDSGVVPDLEVSAEDALLAAHEKALETLIQRAPDDDDRRYRQWALESVRLRKRPYEPSSDSLEACVGEYTNAVRIERIGDALTFSWSGRTYALTPLSEHRFELDHGMQRATFTVDNGQATEFLWETEDGDAWNIRRVDEDSPAG